MKIACFSDLHGHIFKEFDTPSDRTGSGRLDRVVDTILYMGQYCLANGINCILFGGDLFHARGKVDTKVYNAIYDAIKSIGEQGIILVMIAGNHDDYDNSNIPANSLHPFKQLKNVYVYDDITYHILKVDGEMVIIDCIPFTKDTERVKQHLLEIDHKHDIPLILLMHAGVSGAVVGSHSYPLAEAFTVEDLQPDKFKYIVLGHFHKRQFLGGYPHVFYTGTPIQSSFNDEGEDKGIYVIDTNKRWDVEFVPIPNPKFITVTDKVTPEELQEYKEQGHYIRIKANEESLTKMLSEVPEGLQFKTEITKTYEQDKRVDVSIGMNFREIVTKYAQEFKPEGLEIGLKILEEVEGK